MKEIPETLAHISEIVTAIVAGGASSYFWIRRRSQRIRLESYLRAEKSRGPDEFRSTTRLMAELGMTEYEILNASFASDRITRGVRVDSNTGFAAEVLFRYSDQNT
jgi:hypothetical protein